MSLTPEDGPEPVSVRTSPWTWTRGVEYVFFGAATTEFADGAGVFWGEFTSGSSSSGRWASQTSAIVDRA